MENFEQPNRGLGQVFENKDGKNLGNVREVYEAKGKEGVDFIVKDKISDYELQVLQFLSELGISEKLLIYDQGKLVFEKVDGKMFGDYIDELVKSNPNKITEVKPIGDLGGDKRFVVHNETSEYLPENIIFGDERIRNFIVDYVSKLIFLVLNGILHKDIKKIMFLSIKKIKLNL